MAITSSLHAGIVGLLISRRRGIRLRRLLFFGGRLLAPLLPLSRTSDYHSRRCSGALEPTSTVG